jgi:hypothetical protein
MKGYVWAWVLIQSSGAMVLFHNFGVLDDNFFVYHHHHPHHTSMCFVSYFFEQEEYYQVGTSA